jgi:hypothetical protein
MPICNASAPVIQRQLGRAARFSDSAQASASSSVMPISP